MPAASMLRVEEAFAPKLTRLRTCSRSLALSVPRVGSSAAWPGGLTGDWHAASAISAVATSAMAAHSRTLFGIGMSLTHDAPRGYNRNKWKQLNPWA